MGIAGIGFTTLKYHMNSLYTGFFKIMVDLPGLVGGLKFKSSNKAPKRKTRRAECLRLRARAVPPQQIMQLPPWQQIFRLRTAVILQNHTEVS